MGWFDEQIRQRIEHDESAFENAFDDLASVVMGDKLARKLSDERVQTKSAIDEILRYYRVKPLELPDNISDINDQLEYLMRPSGIMRRVVKLEGEWYRDAVGAMLGTRSDTGKPVALLPGRMAGYSFLDVTTGERIKLNRKTAGLISEEAICFYKPLPLKKLSIKDLLLFMFQARDMSDTIMMGVAALASTLVGMLLPKLNNICLLYTS